MAEEEYLTRGALLQCNCGTHMRRLNLPVDHGVQLDTKDGYKHPLVEEKDCVMEANVKYFGICKKMQGNPNIVLQPYSPSGQPLATGVIEGIKCVPVLGSKWMDTKEKTFIKDGGVFKAVTTKSYLICSCGGRIEPKTSGIEYKGEQDA